MTNDNRVSATLSAQAVTDVLGHVAAIRELLPFLLTLSPQERKELPKMGDKSVGFDDKCVAYMGSHVQFLPGFVDLAEVQKDRDLRTQMMRVAAEIEALAQSLDDTLKVVSSEVWMADLAYYQNVREAARRGRAGAQEIYVDLRHRFPGAGGAGASPAAVAAGAASGGRAAGTV